MQIVAAFFYAVTALATCFWWGLLFMKPESKAWFFGHQYAGSLPPAFLLPDLVSAFLLSVWLVTAVLHGSPSAILGAALHAGGQGYGFLVTIGLAAQDSAAYWGVVCMMFSSGAAMVFALALNCVPILRGPFQFRPSLPRDGRCHWRQALKQTAVMWAVFLFAIPAVTAAIESALGWNQYWWNSPARLALAIPVFVFGGAIGLWSGWVMTQLGAGTPLPSAHPTRLVVAGPYRVVRNPMAVGGIAQGVAVGIGIGSPLVVCYALLGGVAWDVLTRPLEEQHLEGLFEESYIDYRRAVRCWIPSPPYRPGPDIN